MESLTDIKGKSTDEIVSRRMMLPDLRCGHCETVVRDALDSLDGMVEVSVDLASKCVIVRYDVVQLDYVKIENTLRDIGYPPANNIWNRLRASWYSFLDDNIKANATAESKPCCHNTSGLFAGRKKH